MEYMSIKKRCYITLKKIYVLVLSVKSKRYDRSTSIHQNMPKAILCATVSYLQVTTTLRNCEVCLELIQAASLKHVKYAWLLRLIFNEVHAMILWKENYPPNLNPMTQFRLTANVWYMIRSNKIISPRFWLGLEWRNQVQWRPEIRFVASFLDSFEVSMDVMIQGLHSLWSMSHELYTLVMIFLCFAMGLLPDT